MTYKQSLYIFEALVNSTGFTPSIHGPNERKSDSLQNSKGFRIELSTKEVHGGVKIIDGAEMAGVIEIVNKAVPSGVGWIANFSFDEQKVTVR